MTELVSRDTIEQLVGAARRDTEHLGRHIPEAGMTYILHSRQCLSHRIDLRACPYSVALDEGIDPDAWIGYENQPVYLAIHEVYGDLHALAAVEA